MTNELTRVIDAIKTDPHGQVARNAAHWLAVNVMRWELKNDVRGRLYASWYVGESVPNPIDYVAFYKSHWKPFTDANHTRMLVQKVGTMRFCGELLLNHYRPDCGNFRYVLDPYNDDPTHDACAVLGKFHETKTLTDETLEGFLDET